MLSKKEVVVILNGSMIGTTRTAVSNLHNLARDFNQEKIQVFIETWEHPDNQLWLDSIINTVKTINSAREIIKLDITKHKYNSKEAYEFFHSFQSNLGLDDVAVYPNVTKKVFYFYTLVKALQKVEKYNKDAFILRMVSNIYVDIDLIPFQLSSPTFRNTLLEQYYCHVPISAPPNSQGIDFTDLLFTPSVSFDSIEEKIWFSSFKVAKNIYSTNLEEILNRVSDVYNSYRKDRDIETVSPFTLSKFLEDRFFTPISTGTIVRQLLEKYSPSTIILPSPGIYTQYKVLEGLINPWLTIYPDKVEDTVPLYIKYHKDHLVQP
jgi:hypothetical protein